jgi:hypothetical protein
LPASLSATGGLKVEKESGVWTFSPEWTDLSLETTIPEPEARQLWTLNPNTGVYTRLSVQALIDNLPEGPTGDAGSLIFVQNSSPANDKPEGSLWIDADSADLDLYQLTSGSWGDTGTNLKGDAGDSPSLFVQNDAPATSYLEGSLWIDADSGTNDLYQLQSGVWVDTGVNLKGADGTGTGDVSHGSAISVDNEIVLFSGTGGKTIKRATTTGVLKASSGVIAAAVAGTDYLAPSDIGVTVQAYDANTLTTANGVAQGLHTIWIPASAFKSRATNGAEAITYDSGANDVTLAGFGFDTTSQEYIHSIPIRMPKSWNEGTVTAQIDWTNTGGSSTQTVRWTVAGRAVGDDDAINGVFGTAVNLDDTWLAQNDMHKTSVSSAITIGNTPAEGDTVIFEVSRDVANDNMSGDAVFLGMTLFITINAANDA